MRFFVRYVEEFIGGPIRGPFGVHGRSVLVDFCIRYDEFNRQVKY